MRRITVSAEERRELVSRKVTLNGEPAAICGASLDFPRVAQLSSGLSVEFSWPTVRLIVDTKGGRFTA